jgi:hypothetical protein
MRINHGARMLDLSGKRRKETTLIAEMGDKNKGYGEATRITTGPDHGHHVAKVVQLRRRPLPRK